MDDDNGEIKSPVSRAENKTSVANMQKEDIVLEDEPFFNGAEVLIEPVFDLSANSPEEQIAKSTFMQNEYDKTQRELRTIEFILDVTVIFIRKLLGW